MVQLFKIFVMEIKKTEKASLENKRNLFLQTGLSIALMLTLTAFELTFYTPGVDNLLGISELLDEDHTIITIQDEKPQLKKPAPPVLKIEIVDKPFVNDTTSDIFNEDTSAAVTPLKKIDVDTTDTEEIYEPWRTTKRAEFKGGDEALAKWLIDNVKYPPQAIKEGIQGKVYIKFAVMKNGIVSNVMLTDKVDYYLDNEALRVVSEMPVWVPALLDGLPVNSYVILPIRFSLVNR